MYLRKLLVNDGGASGISDGTLSVQAEFESQDRHDRLTRIYSRWASGFLSECLIVYCSYLFPYYRTLQQLINFYLIMCKEKKKKSKKSPLKNLCKLLRSIVTTASCPGFPGFNSCSCQIFSQEFFMVISFSVNAL